MGEFAKAKAAYQETMKWASPNDPIRPTVQGLIRKCDYLAELYCKLLTFVRGEAEPASAAERLDLAVICQLPKKRLYAAAVHFYATAFMGLPGPGADIRNALRYRAACCAAQAGTPVQRRDSNVNAMLHPKCPLFALCREGGSSGDCRKCLVLSRFLRSRWVE
jgi:hypothetical protein